MLEDHTQIHRVNRAQIIKDSLTLARANLVDYSLALATTKYLSKELEYIPWSPAISELTYIGKMIGNSKGSTEYKNYMIKFLAPLFRKLGVMHKDSDGFMDILLRALVTKTLCNLNYKPCINSTLELYDKWKQCKIFLHF